MIDFGVMQCSMVEDVEVSTKFIPTGFLPSVDLYIENIPLAVQIQSQWRRITAKTITVTDTQLLSKLHTITLLTVEKAIGENFCSYFASSQGKFYSTLQTA